MLHAIQEQGINISPKIPSADSKKIKTVRQKFILSDTVANRKVHIPIFCMYKILISILAYRLSCRGVKFQQIHKLFNLSILKGINETAKLRCIVCMREFAR